MLYPRTRFMQLMIGVLSATLALPAQSVPSGHVVAEADLQKAMENASQTRLAQAAALQDLFRGDRAQKAFREAHLDGQQVVQAIPFLSDAELANLSSRAAVAQQEFAAGALTNQQLTYIVIALATAVVILVIVVH